MKYTYMDNVTHEAFMFDSLKELKQRHKEKYPSLELKKGIRNTYYV